MHIPDGFVSGPVNAVGAAAATTCVGYAAWRVRRQVAERPMAVPLLATTAAFVFAAQMLNFPIGGGTSGHFLGAITVAALLGPWSACLVMALVLVVQCLLFADGGLTALGTNIFNMGLVAGIGGYFLMRALRALLPAGRSGYLLSAAIASWASVLAASAFCALELSFSGTSPLVVALPAMAGTHAIIGVGEALICVAVLGAVTAARPDVLPEWARVNGEAAPRSARRKAWILTGAGLVLSLALAVLVSPFASGHPDGLEKVAEDKGFIERAEGQEAWTKSPVPDYAVPGVENEKAATGLAGLIGTAGIFIVGFGAIKLAGARRKSRAPAE